MIPVTKPYLPPIERYQSYIKDIYQREWLTNNGPLVQELEKKLGEYLNIQELLLVSNGTLALQLAIKALDLKGEIITTPFSFVATTSSIVWEGATPVFVDIDASTLNIDPQKIEAAITEKTSAILATHCFGNACDIETIDKIAKKHKLKVIYDAAHCFGTLYQGKSIFEYGDVSCTSLHATKLMHSVEGGVVFSKDKEVFKRMWYMRNFGHDGFEKYNGVGINAKNSEFHAAMGLAVLEDIQSILEKRREQCLFYDELLQDSPIERPRVQKDCEYNYAYYPVLFKDETTTLKVKEALEEKSISPRRYFYPSLSHLEYVDSYSTPIADKIAKSILCLPLYYELKAEEQKVIINIIRGNLL